MNNEHGISVLVRTFNSGKTLGRLFAGLTLSEPDELIVVDSGSSDSTLEMAAQYRAKVIIAEGPFNYSKSLNLGFLAARNPWVLVISSHCIPAVDGFMDIYRREIIAFPKDVLAGYAPSTLSGDSDPLLNKTQTSYFAKSDYASVSRVCGNGNTIYRRTAWEELPFDEMVRTAEDKIWIMAMIERGYRFAYIPAAKGLNINQGSLVYMFRKGYSDAIAKEAHTPMKVWHLGGALKKLVVQKLKGEIGFGNWARYSAHTFGQFFGSWRPEDNTPWTKKV